MKLAAKMVIIQPSKLSNDSYFKSDCKKTPLYRWVTVFTQNKATENFLVVLVVVILLNYKRMLDKYLGINQRKASGEE